MRTISFVAGALVMAAACASQPKPEPAPTPIATAPATTPRPAPAAVTPPTNPGPLAGSRADFESKAQTRIYFDYDRYELSAEAKSALAAQAAWLKQYPGVRVQIEGNADERGTREYNIALGYRRAEAVASHLMSLGVDTGRITTVSYGKDRPIDGGSNEAAWARNRNGHTNIVSGATS
jgi:peptidoglycan-associated lipoprotein